MVELNTLLLPLGVIPAIFILYFVIRNYEGRYQEKSMVLLFIAGIIAGMVIYTMEGMIFYQIIGGAIYINILLFFSLLFSMVEQIVKFASINMKRFNDAPPLYGASFSLGFSTVLAPLLFGATYTINTKNAFLLFIPFSMMFFNASSGIFLGTGIKRKMALKFFLFTLFSGALIWMSVILSLFYSAGGTECIIFSLFSLLFSLLLFYYAMRYTLVYGMMERRELRKMEKKTA